jgi:hypothetical protein
VGIKDIGEIISISLQIRRRIGHSVTLPMQRIGVRFIVP